LAYVKLDCGITKSTIWMADSDTVRIWIYLLAEADLTGIVMSTLPAIARDNLMPAEKVRTILKSFMEPDPDSRDPENEGRRIVIHCEPTWAIEILNYGKYREKDFSHAERQRAYRRRKKKIENGDVTRDEKSHSDGDVTQRVTQAEAEVQVQVQKVRTSSTQRTTTATLTPRECSDLFEAFYAAYPKHENRKGCDEKWRRLMRESKNPRELAAVIMAGLDKLKTQCRKWREGYAPGPLVFLNQERWNDEPQPMTGPGGEPCGPAALRDAIRKQEAQDVKTQ